MFNKDIGMLKSMNIVELQTKLQNLKNCRISFTEIGVALGTGRSNISKRAKENSQVKDIEIKKIENYFNVDLEKELVILQEPIDDKIEINYWEELPDELKNPKIRSVWYDKEVIENKWFVNPSKLCVIPMFSDALSNYWYKINDGDLLIVDTEYNKIIEPAVYFATSRNNTRYWIREIDLLANENVEFRRYTQSGMIIKTYTLKELEETDFKIIGRVIKNVSLRI